MIQLKVPHKLYMLHRSREQMPCAALITLTGWSGFSYDYRGLENELLFPRFLQHDPVVLIL